MIQVLKLFRVIEEGKQVGDRLREIVEFYERRTSHVKELIVQPPTPSTSGSEKGYKLFFKFYIHKKMIWPGTEEAPEPPPLKKAKSEIKDKFLDEEEEEDLFDCSVILRKLKENLRFPETIEPQSKNCEIFPIEF